MLALAVIALFAVGIAWELRESKKLGIRIYDFHETASHLAISFGQQVLNLFTMGWLVAVYSLVENQFSLFHLSDASGLNWAVVIVASDFCYYVAHRMAHRVNFFIGVHSVHHQAKDFNYASALRLPWLNRLIMFVFYLPLAVLGVPGKMVAVAFLFNLLVGSFAHNGILRGKMGWLHYVFVTPRTHYVHHGISGKYLDRNFGGVFIFWDRLFGSFQDLDENEPVILPGKESPDHWNPVLANFDYFEKLAFVSRRRSPWLSRFTIYFASPERLHSELERLGYMARTRKKPLQRGTWRSVWVSFGATILLMAALVWAVNGHKPLGLQVLLGCAVFLGSWMIGERIQRIPNRSAPAAAPARFTRPKQKSGHRRVITKVRARLPRSVNS
jgi:alkylglycerol monooxygenase